MAKIRPNARRVVLPRCVQAREKLIKIECVRPGATTESRAKDSKRVYKAASRCNVHVATTVLSHPSFQRKRFLSARRSLKEPNKKPATKGVRHDPNRSE